MLRSSYNAGYQAALSRFKLSNMQAGAAAYNPAINPGAASGAGASIPVVGKAPTPPAAPMAAAAPKSNVLG